MNCRGDIERIEVLECDPNPEVLGYVKLAVYCNCGHTVDVWVSTDGRVFDSGEATCWYCDALVRVDMRIQVSIAGGYYG